MVTTTIASPAGVWFASARLLKEVSDEHVRYRHRSLPDAGLLGVLVRPASDVGALIEFLAIPRTDAELREAFPSPELDAALVTLGRAGIIFRSPDEEEELVTSGAVRTLARLVDRLASEVRARSGDALRRGDGTTIAEDVRRAAARVESLVDELRRTRDEYVAAQVAPFRSARELRLHLGCGGHEIDGWVNIDIVAAPVRMDMRWGLPFDEGSVEAVYLANVLEHFRYPDEAGALLAEARRVLRPGGRIRIVVPDIERCIEAYVRDDRAFFEERKRWWPWARACQTRLDHFLAYAGAGAPGYDYIGHKYGYDYETLSHLLTTAGFSTIRRSEYMGSADPSLQIDDHCMGAQSQDGGRYSLFVEATHG